MTASAPATVPAPERPLHRALRDLHRQAGGIIDESVEANAEALGSILQLDRDLSKWIVRIADRPEERQLGDARSELGHAIYAAASGNYRLAYAATRLFLELSFAGVHFSANELHRRRWLSDREDFSWSRALDKDEGVLAVSFVREFNDSALIDAPVYAEMAAGAYRHCSQFVHGKFAATQTLPQKLGFSSQVLSDWAATTSEAAKSVLYLFYCRYGTEFLIGDDGPLVETLENHFAHLRSIRAVIGLPVEGE